MNMLVASFSLSASGSATATWGKEHMKLSSTGPSKTLPSFLWMAGAEEGGGIFGGFNYTGSSAQTTPPKCV